MPWHEVKLTKEDLEAFRKKEPYKMEGHTFDTNTRIAGKQYCKKCGLVALNNEFTRWSIEKGCNSINHPDYEMKRRKFTKL